MYQLPPDLLQRLVDAHGNDILKHGKRGIEKESLRIDRLNGALSQTPHPEALGAALTHPFITTDYAESLLEFVTPALDSNDEAIQFLADLHKYTYEHIPGETLWPCSMPCGFSKHSDVPLARYGDSNVGKMKTIYRRGLGHRYGRIMQTIAGVHFNYSLPKEVWPALCPLIGSDICSSQSSEDFQSAGYFALIRNFKRLSWLILYLFGSSPAVCKSFFQGAETGLSDYPGNTAAGEFATSLRMSDIGYNNHAQASLNISVNSLNEYVAGLTRAISTPYTQYEQLGLTQGDKRIQLSTSILQIANEFYSVVRPKRVAHSGEEPTAALRRRGVEYVEIRALDLDPFSRVGVNPVELDFVECLLLHCAFNSSPAISAVEQVEIVNNDDKVASYGRKPGLLLQRDGAQIPLSEWAGSVCQEVLKVAEVLDANTGEHRFADAVQHQISAIEDSSRTPSARVLEALSASSMTYNEFGLARAQTISTEYEQEVDLASSVESALEELATESLSKAALLKAEDTQDFDTYLADYFSRGMV
ncbi:MAG: glutamate--cysteine ligase [Gammaproteobacteria bacterium]